MIKLNPLKNALVFIVTITYCCFAGITSAQEIETETASSSEAVQPSSSDTESTDEQTVEATPQPTNEAQATDITSEEKTSPPAEPSTTQIAAPVPQPPVIDTQAEPSYEPKTVVDTAEEKTNQPAEPAIEQIAKPVPQPPQIDAQPEPNYEPATTANTSEEDSATPTTEALEPSTDQTIDTESSDTAEVDTEQITKQEKKPAEAITKWSDTRPALVSADWLQLISGEWLRGRIIAMQEDDLEFDSDELKKLVIEWKKVRYIKTSTPYRLRFDDQVQAIGAIEITQQEVHVTTDYDDLTFDRKKLLTIASGKETEISYWTAKISFSINVRRGNTDQTDFTSMMTAKRQTLLSRLVLEYLGNFTAVEQAETINNHRLNGIYNIFITRELFLPLVSAEYFRDPFQNIEKRVYIGTGIGYNLIKTNKNEWQVSGGPAYQATKFVSVQPDQSLKDSSFTLILSTKFDFELNSKVDLEGSYTATLGDDATGDYSHHSIVTVETELTDDLDLDTSLVWDRTREPVEDANGVTPEQDDFRILIGLGYDL